MLRRLILSAPLVLATLFVAASPATGDHICHEESVEVAPGVFKLVDVCDPHGDEEDAPVPDPVGDVEPEVTCDPRESFDAGVGQPTPRENGSWWVAWPYDCSDGTTQLRSRCVAACPEGVVTVATIPGLRLEALARIDPPLPGVRHSFDQPAANGDIRAIVLAETWWWGQNSYDPITAQESDGPLWVEVTATPGELIIDPGDGSDMLSCPGPGVAFNHGQSYYQQVPGEPKGSCVHVYEEVFDQVTATMTVTWEVTWQGYTPSAGTVGGTLDPIVRQEQVSFPVRELQSVIVYSDGAGR